MHTLIIEVRGGLVQEVYSDAKELPVILVDCDAGESVPTMKVIRHRF